MSQGTAQCKPDHDVTFKADVISFDFRSNNKYDSKID